MPDSKMTIYVNLMQLVGSHLIEETTRSGRPAFVLDVQRSRARIRRDPRGKRDPELWLPLEAVQSSKMANEMTHFVTEPVTKAELKQGLRSKPIGAARLYITVTQQPANA